MRARESGLWQWLRGAEQCFGQRLHWHRIENVLERGTPDVEGCVDGVGFVIELKSVPRRPRGDVWCELSSEQAQFLRARRRAGGMAFVLVQVGVGHAVRRYLIWGEDSDKLLRPLPEEDLQDMHIVILRTRPEDIVQAIIDCWEAR